jgi:hypothetical protein
MPPFAALVLTGHLRDTCEVERGLATVHDQAASCRRAFDGNCDVFIHTWDRLGKSTRANVTSRCDCECSRERRLHNAASHACLLNLSAMIRPVATMLETQPLEDSDSQHATEVGSFAWNHNVFRMNAMSISAGVGLMTRHSILARRDYTAAVRLRADVGSRKIRNRGVFREQFLNHEGWRIVRKAADTLERSKTRRGLHPRKNEAKEKGRRRDNELFFCGNSPRKQRVDFCTWSVPPKALVQAVEALRDERYDTLAANDSCRNTLLDTLRAPIVPENMFLCAMHAQGLSAGWAWHVNSTGGPQPDPKLNLNDPIEKLKRVC